MMAGTQNNHGAELQSVETVLLKNLAVDTCAETLHLSKAFGFTNAYNAALNLATAQFRRLIHSPGFLLLDEQTLAALFDSDHLVADCEEQIFESEASCVG